ncbi:MAG: two-component system response regulator [Candidatus Levyibacteriota bacterium]
MEETQKKKVLLIDDDAQFTSGLQEKIRNAGMEVFAAKSGKEALDYLVEHEVDFIILDFIMPEMDGYTFHHILTHDMKKDIPTIILTNLEGSEDSEQKLEVFTKAGTDLDALIGKIKDRLDGVS